MILFQGVLMWEKIKPLITKNNWKYLNIRVVYSSTTKYPITYYLYDKDGFDHEVLGFAAYPYKHQDARDIVMRNDWQAQVRINVDVVNPSYFQEGENGMRRPKIDLAVYPFREKGSKNLFITQFFSKKGSYVDKQTLGAGVVGRVYVDQNTFGKEKESIRRTRYYNSVGQSCNDEAIFKYLNNKFINASANGGTMSPQEADDLMRIGKELNLKIGES